MLQRTAWYSDGWLCWIVANPFFRGMKWKGIFFGVHYRTYEAHMHPFQLVTHFCEVPGFNDLKINKNTNVNSGHLGFLHFVWSKLANFLSHNPICVQQYHIFSTHRVIFNPPMLGPTLMVGLRSTRISWIYDLRFKMLFAIPNI